MQTLPKPGTPVVGHSLTSCLMSLARGDVALEDVVRIETSSTFNGIDQLDAMIRHTMQSRHLDRYLEIAAGLYAQGKIVPRPNLTEKILEHGIWMADESACPQSDPSKPLEIAFLGGGSTGPFYDKAAAEKELRRMLRSGAYRGLYIRSMFA